MAATIKDIMTMELNAANTASFWQQITPGLTISNAVDNSIINKAPIAGCLLSKDKLITEGYQQFNGVIESSLVTVMRTGIASLHKQGWLPVFSMLYDEYWEFVSSLRGLIVDTLGEEAKMMPDFWAWFVDPTQEQAGWRPHRDKNSNTLLDDGMPKSLTVWVPLTDATPLNGCMYMIPADRDQSYKDFAVNAPQVDLQSIRALSAPAGSVIIWNQRVYHWGGRSSKHAEQPRLSMAFEFQRGDVPPFNSPLLPLQILPNFELRRKLVGKQILQYKHMYSYSSELVKLAEHMLN